MKENIQRLKNDIKGLSTQQKTLKNQRKTVNRIGKKLMEPWQADYQHGYNRWDLRHMYLAYGLLRGKSVDVTEPNRKTPIDMELVDKFMEKYAEKVEVAKAA